MGKLEDKLAKLEEQRARINAEIQRVRAREQQQERRDDTRRKIIVGAMLTGMIEAGKLGQFNEVWLRAELDKQLDRDPDRALFGLPPLAKAKPEQVVQEEAPAGLHTAPTAAQEGKGRGRGKTALRASCGVSDRHQRAKPAFPPTAQQWGGCVA